MVINDSQHGSPRLLAAIALELFRLHVIITSQLLDSKTCDITAAGPYQRPTEGGEWG
jgi:hypothetical protein